MMSFRCVLVEVRCQQKYYIFEVLFYDFCSWLVCLNQVSPIPFEEMFIVIGSFVILVGTSLLALLCRPDFFRCQLSSSKKVCHP